MKQKDNRAKPLKRPSQDRSKFTVRAIYGGFVRIWRQKGWEGITTRAVAAESGVSIGTFYEYFPNKQALLSGYIRDCIETLLDQIEREVMQPADLTWKERIRKLVEVTFGIDATSHPYFDSEMLSLEHLVAEPKHHQRVYEELSQRWIKVLENCTDLPNPPTQNRVKALFMSVWGGYRYLLLVDPIDMDASVWVEQVTQMCHATLMDIG